MRINATKNQRRFGTHKTGRAALAAIGLISLSLLFGGCSMDNSPDGLEFQSGALYFFEDYDGVIRLLDEKMEDANTSAKLIHYKGTAYIMTGDYDSGRQTLEAGLSTSLEDEEKALLYNDLSRANYLLEDYNKALFYSSLCIETTKSGIANDYLNYANALLALDNDDEAERAYDSAASKDSGNAETYFGLGRIYYNRQDYEGAVTQLEKAYKLSSSFDVCRYLGIAYMQRDGDPQKAVEYLNRADELAKKTAEKEALEVSWIQYDLYMEDYLSAINRGEPLIEKNPYDYELVSGLVEALIQSQRYEEALSHLAKAWPHPNELINDITSYRKKMLKLELEVHVNANQPEKVEDTVNALINWEKKAFQKEAASARDKKNSSVEGLNKTGTIKEREAEIYNEVGDMFYYLSDYLNAVPYFEKALELLPKDETSAVNIAAALYYSKRYYRCLEFVDGIQATIESPSLYRFAAWSYSELMEPDEAIEMYKQVLNFWPDEANIQTEIGWEYYYKQDYIHAREWAERTLKSSPSDTYARELLNSVALEERPLDQRISEFIEQNYLYYSDKEAYQKVKAQLSTKTKQDADDVEALLNAAILPNDYFTYILKESDYVNEVQYEDYATVYQLEREGLDEETVFVRISSFEANTGVEFLDILDTISNTEDKALILDMRYNYGGETQSGIEIADSLLPEVVISNLIYRNGEAVPYYSDRNQVAFKHIYILVDEETASCAELLTLALRTYLDNVTVIGRTTFGKGVGQLVLEDRIKGYYFFLVNHYWNIREMNINGVGIKPDIPVKGSEIEDYLRAINPLN